MKFSFVSIDFSLNNMIEVLQFWFVQVSKLTRFIFAKQEARAQGVRVKPDPV